MVFNCRESCGTCGFRSDIIATSQIVNGKDFSDIISPDFFCGTAYNKEVIQRIESILGEKLYQNSVIPGMVLPEEIESDESEATLRQDDLPFEEKQLIRDHPYITSELKDLWSPNFVFFLFPWTYSQKKRSTPWRFY